MKDSPDPQHAADQASGISFEELERIFEQVAKLSLDRQEAMLEKLCPDISKRQQVRALLDADSSADPLLDHSLLPEPLNVHAGEQVADYKLLQELGRGGMGVVFMAEQLEPVRRKVALKVIKPGVDTREVIARFDAERQALSLMDHPNIAKVLDAGSTDAGRPYFVMELVKGQPITAYCEQRQLSVTNRLELFLAVCRAIQHAHQKGIIHRDIKPSNILVAEYDRRPVAKVIDFGVAKAIHQSLTDMTVNTEFGQIIGTFDYMSPEQSRVNQMDVDTRSDIYSLGVLLYELLAGSPPFDKDRLRSVAWDEMLRIIREEDPPKPSTRLTHTSQPRSIGEREQIQSAKLGRMVAGELDWIVMKAMEKDRNRRYGTPNGLANDIQCFLNGDAVAACPPSPMYLFRKFAQRNKAILATSAIVAASLVLGMIGTTWQAIRALRAEEAAEVSAVEAGASAMRATVSAKKAAISSKQAEAINDFLEDDLLGLAGAESQLSAGLLPDPNLKLLTLLELALAKVDERFASDPHGMARLKATLASSFNSIGRYEEATPLYKHYFKYLEQTKGIEDPATIRVMRQLGRVYIDQSLLSEAEPICTTALENSRRVLGENHNVTLRLLNDLGILYQKQGDYQKAEAALLACIEIQRGLPKNRQADTLSIQSNLALLYESLNRFDDAQKLHQSVLDVHENGTDQLRMAAALSNLGRCCLKRGRFYEDDKQFDAAWPPLKKGAEIYELQRGDDHPDTLAIRSNLAHVYCELGRHDDAATILVDLVERLRRLRGSEDITTLEAMNLLGWTYLHLDRLAEAENILRNALANSSGLNPVDPWRLQVRGNLAIVYHRIGKLEKCVSLDSETLELATEVLGPDHAETLASMARLGLSYLEIGQADAGRALLASAFDTDPNLPGAFKVAGRLATSYAQEGDLQMARSWTDRQLESARNNLPSSSLQLAKIQAECELRLLKMKARTKAK